MITPRIKIVHYCCLLVRMRALIGLLIVATALVVVADGRAIRRHASTMDQASNMESSSDPFPPSSSNDDAPVKAQNLNVGNDGGRAKDEKKISSPISDDSEENEESHQIPTQTNSAAASQAAKKATASSSESDGSSSDDEGSEGVTKHKMPALSCKMKWDPSTRAAMRDVGISSEKGYEPLIRKDLAVRATTETITLKAEVEAMGAHRVEDHYLAAVIIDGCLNTTTTFSKAPGTEVDMMNLECTLNYKNLDGAIRLVQLLVMVASKGYCESGDASEYFLHSGWADCMYNCQKSAYFFLSEPCSDRGDSSYATVNVAQDSKGKCNSKDTRKRATRKCQEQYSHCDGHAKFHEKIVNIGYGRIIALEVLSFFTQNTAIVGLRQPQLIANDFGWLFIGGGAWQGRDTVRELVIKPDEITAYQSFTQSSKMMEGMEALEMFDQKVAVASKLNYLKGKKVDRTIDFTICQDGKCGPNTPPCPQANDSPGPSQDSSNSDSSSSSSSNSDSSSISSSSSNSDSSSSSNSSDSDE